MAEVLGLHKFYKEELLVINMAEEGVEIGVVSNYFKNVKAAAIKLTAPLKVGDKIRIRGGDKDFEMVVESMQINRGSVEKAKKGDDIGLLVTEDVKKGYKIYKA